MQKIIINRPKKVDINGSLAIEREINNFIEKLPAKGGRILIRSAWGKPGQVVKIYRGYKCLYTAKNSYKRSESHPKCRVDFWMKKERMPLFRKGKDKIWTPLNKKGLFKVEVYFGVSSLSGQMDFIDERYIVQIV